MDIERKHALEGKLMAHRSKVKKRYKYYEMKNVVEDFGISTPPSLQYFTSALGWCGKAVDSLADRLQFRGFRNDVFDIGDIFRVNNPDIFTDSAILGALISGCNFVYVSPGEEGRPRLQVIDGANATGTIDPITGMLKEGYAVLDADEYGQPTVEATFEPYKLEIINHGELEVYETAVPYPLLVPIIYRPDAVRPFGRSRISRACMSHVDSALRTIKRSEIAAEFYSYPQKYVTGLAQDAEIADKWKATLSSIITFTKDEDGDKPSVGQFSQQSMAPHIEQLRMFASLFAGETGLTLDDLGFATGNPASADAIKAAHENLRLSAVKAQRTLGSGLLNVGIVASCLRDNFAYTRDAFYDTVPMWEPLFTPDASMLSSIGDGAIKLNQAVPEFIDAENLRDLTGIE